MLVVSRMIAMSLALFRSSLVLFVAFSSVEQVSTARLSKSECIAALPTFRLTGA